jgi:hypothetical protein
MATFSHAAIVSGGTKSTGCATAAVVVVVDTGCVVVVVVVGATVVVVVGSSAITSPACFCGSGRIGNKTLFGGSFVSETAVCGAEDMLTPTTAKTTGASTAPRHLTFTRYSNLKYGQGQFIKEHHPHLGSPAGQALSLGRNLGR